MEEIKDLLGEEIKAEIKALSSLPPGYKEKTEAIDNLVKLYKLRIDETASEQDANEKCERLTEQVKERYFRLGIAAAEIILPMVFYAAWMRRGFRFEETGTYTSTTFKGLFNRFKPTKK